MEKLRKLNQILFTIMAILLISLIAIALFNLVKTLFIKDYPIDEKNEMLSQEKVDKLLSQEKYKELISFLKIHPIRDSNDLIIIPVTQISLTEPQKIRKMIRLNDIGYRTFPKFKSLSSSYNYYYENKLLNNLLIYSLKNNSSYPVFNNRICITDFINYTVKDKYFLYLVVAEKDSNNDGKLDDNDLKDIYIYDILLKTLKKITSTSEYVLDTKRIFKTDYVIIKVGIDKNDDGQYSPENEPTILKSLNVVDMSYTNFIGVEMQQKLQDILSGK